MHAGEVLVFGLHEQARCLFYLDLWDEVFMADKLPGYLLLQPTCVQQSLMASVHALRGEHQAAAVLRDEAVAYKVAIAGPEARSRSAHY
jgi:hypothetical protein